MRIALSIAIAAAASGCGPVPRTLDEQRAYVEIRSRGHVEPWTVSGAPHVIGKRLFVHMRECFTGTAIHEGQAHRAGGHSSGHAIRKTYSVRAYDDPASGLLSLAVQMEANTHGGARRGPEGGQFLWHVDLRALGDDDTELTYYGRRSSVSESQIAALRAWASGEEASCPPPK